MSLETIDLTQERCPMTLLLAKRASSKLSASQALTFVVAEKSSVHDMQAYFLRHNMQVDVRKEPHCYYLTIIKE
ncbi:sulfurtransferase TusA family protein [Vibrio rarus]|uniref:sulfurtransferase TusA family protein n=1 Tax=Vibrio rarus TaxID=413403 RepID=UPI0021C370E1|nr:sulfurtransferase TusA family protein [Vibrio rarus]